MNFFFAFFIAVRSGIGEVDLDREITRNIRFHRFDDILRKSRQIEGFLSRIVPFLVNQSIDPSSRSRRLTFFFLSVDAPTMTTTTMEIRSRSRRLELIFIAMCVLGVDAKQM